MKRSIIKQGHNTLTITLPVKWCKRIGLKGGEEIEIEEKNNALVVNPAKSESIREIFVQSDDLERISSAKVISAAYELGIDKIKIHLGKEKAKCWYYGVKDFEKTVDYFVDALIGFEITSKTDNKITIENLSKPLLKFDSIIHKIFFMNMQFLENYIEALEKKDKIMLKDSDLRHNNITRFTSLGWRVIYEDNAFTKAESLNYFVIVHKLDKVADFLRYAYRATQLDKCANKKTIDMAKKCYEYIEMYKSFFYKYDLKKVNELERIRWEFKNHIKSIKDVDCMRVACYMESIIEVLYGAIKPRILMAIDRRAEQG